MKILWLNAGLLLPLDKGGKLRTWHVLRHLAERHDITYLSFGEPSDIRVADPNRDCMRHVCSLLVSIARTYTAKGTWRFHADMAKYLLVPSHFVLSNDCTS